MAGIGWQELMIVLVIVMFIFGAGKVPEIMRNLGTGVREIQSAAKDMEETKEAFEKDRV